jgi:hypothetical protein
MAYSADERRSMMGASETLRLGAKEFEGLSESEKDAEKRFLYLRLAGLCSFMSSLYVQGVRHSQDLNMLFDAIEKAPQGSDLDELKAIVAEIKKENVVTLQIPQELEKELKEWLIERQRAKKIQGQYVK